MKPRLLTGITITPTLIFPCSSDQSLKLFAEVTNQQLGDSLCSLMKPHLHHYSCYSHFLMLLTDFHWFHCFHRHSSDTILGFLQIFVIQEEAAHQLHWYPSILLLVWNFISFIVLVIISQTPPFVFFKFLQYENKHIVRVTLSLLDYSSCILLCNWTRWL